MPRKLGSKNKTTIEREEMARLALEVSAQEKMAPTASAVIARVGTKKLGKEILEDFANLFAGLAAYYQPYPPTQGKNPNENESKFREYSMMAVRTAADLAGYQSPKLGAVLVGAAVVSKVEVTGGMPDDFKTPTGNDGEVIDIAPGTIITADDDGAAGADVAGPAAA